MAVRSTAKGRWDCANVGKEFSFEASDFHCVGVAVGWERCEFLVWEQGFNVYCCHGGDCCSCCVRLLDVGVHVDSGSISTSLPVTDVLRGSANDGKLVSYVKL